MQQSIHRHHIIGYLSLALCGIIASIGGLFINYKYASAQIPTLFEGYFAGRDTRQSMTQRQYGGNDFDGLIWRGEYQTLTTPVTVTVGSTSKSCVKQVRALYYNSARGQVLRPLDAESLQALQELDSSYDDMTLDGGLYIGCDGDTSNVFGQVTQTSTNHTYKIVAGVDVNTNINSYDHVFANSLAFTNGTSVGYIVDSVGGVASINGTAPVYPSTPVDLQPSVTPGGGPGPSRSKDTCPKGDTSGDLYDGICQKEKTEHEAPDDNRTGTGLLIDTPADFVREVASTMSDMQCDTDSELIQAYVFAHDIGITTVPDICQAQMQGTLLRKHLAKFLSVRDMKVMGKKPDTTRNCAFSDMTDESKEMQSFAKIACWLGDMGLNRDGTPGTLFRPNDPVTRAEFATAFSRVLYGTKYNTTEDDPRPYYQTHMQALYDDGIMKNISDPEMKEVRGYVMLMMMRSYNKIEK